jgi:glucuronate isomerase
VLSVIKHALFHAIVNREGTDNSDVNVMLKTMYNHNSSNDSAVDSDSGTSIENGLLANKLTALIRNKDIDEALKVMIIYCKNPTPTNCFIPMA